MTSTPVEELAEAFVELAGAAADESGSDDFLNLLADRCVLLLDVSAAGLSLVDERGRTCLVGASGERARVLTLLDDGPGQECQRTGAPVEVTDLGTTKLRWPEFTATAEAAGFAAAYSLPMRRQADVLGALTLFRATPGTPGTLDRVTARIARAMADLATIGLAQVRALRRQTDVAAQLQHALTSRVVIEQAKGVTGERLGLGMDDAFDLLRRYARSRNLRITELAGTVVDGSFDTGLLTPKSD
ncbi:MAG TPA: ANTAR domain-containing protein [Actinophytocola sp.]|nr:ANTAR domain-containing protein [Actinophytocola sp.]